MSIQKHFRKLPLSLFVFLVACTTVIEGNPRPPDPPLRPFEILPNQSVTQSDSGLHTRIRDAKGQEWTIALQLDKGVGIKNVVNGTTYVERWDGDKLTATLRAGGEVWTSTTWRGDKGLKALQLRDWSQRLNAATYVAATAMSRAQGSGGLSRASATGSEDCYQSTNGTCQLVADELGDRGCQIAANSCFAGTPNPVLKWPAYWACYGACRGTGELAKQYGCPWAADYACGTTNGKESETPDNTSCNPNSASCDNSDSQSGNGAGDGTDGDVGNGEDNGAGDWEDPNGTDSGSGNGAGDGTDGDVGNGEDNGAGDWEDPNGTDSGSGNGAGDGTDGDVGNGEDNGSGQGESDPEDWEPPGDWDGNGVPGNGGETGGDYGDYDDYDPSGTDSGSGNGSGNGTDGDVGNGEDNGTGGSYDPNGTESGSGNGAGNGTDGDVGNGEDDGVGSWEECLCM